MQKFQKVAFFKRLVRLNRWSHQKNAGLFVEEKRWPTTCLLCGNNLGATGEPWSWAKVGWIWEFYRPLLFQKFGFFQGPWKPARGVDIGIPSASANSRRPARPFWKCAKSGLGPPVSRDIASKSGEKKGFVSNFCFSYWIKLECWHLTENEFTPKNGCK